MAENWGPGVSRTLSALARQFTGVVWQADKPPLDSELNLMSQVEWENLSALVRAQVHSGFFLDPTRAREDYEVDPLWSNQFMIGTPATVNSIEEQDPVLIAAINGWVFPIAGTQIDATVRNRIALSPPPSTDSRTDFVFLEVWRARVAANPSTVNKPSASTLWKYGNVEYGGTNITDDLEDPAVGFSTTERIQLQYRIRVVGSGAGLGTSIDLANYPDGLTDPQVRAQGTASTPSTFQYVNMRDQLGDPSLWRAGDGDYLNSLGTIDGYVYAVPIAGVFRRNASAFVAVQNSGNPNQNGATDRSPGSNSLPDPRDGARALAQAVLGVDLTSTTTGNIAVTNLVDSALSDIELFPSGTTTRFLVLGTGLNQEIISFTGTSGGLTITVPADGRGRNGTMAKAHVLGTPVWLYDTRPDGLYADQIVRDDIVDLRRTVNFGDWDYTRILQHAIASLAQGNLKTSFKQAGTGGDTFGVVTTEVSYLWGVNSTPPPNYTEQIDGPDGIRTVWSDSAALQPDVTIMVDPNAPLLNGYAATTFSDTPASNWSVGADFQPNGFLNMAGGTVGWTNGSVIWIHLGGTSGTDGARAGFPQSPNPQAVRQVSPMEMWLAHNDAAGGEQFPWRIRFEGGPTGATPSLPATDYNANAYVAGRITTPAAYLEPAAQHPGPMYPLRYSNFERPFIVLGGVLAASLSIDGVAASSTNLINSTSTTGYQIQLLGINFNAFTTPLLRGEHTLREMLTDGNRDRTGNSSQVYIVICGDQLSKDNNGAFRVVGAGTALASGGPYTDQLATDKNNIVVVPLSADFVAFTNNPTESVLIEFRSQFINAEDDQGRASAAPSGIALVFTDLANTVGDSGNPWNSANTGDLAVQNDPLTGKVIPINSKAVISSTLMWHPNRGSSTRVPSKLMRFSAVQAGNTFLRNIPSALDPSFSTLAPYPSGERVFDGAQIQLWNRLPSLGKSAPDAPSYGGLVVGRNEQDREHELFFDLGSKSVIFRPFIKNTMLLKALTTEVSPIPSSLIGPLDYASPPGLLKDGAGIFTMGKKMGFPVPPEFMPRFGRQDIPYHTRISSTDPFMPGINHLFCDETDPTQEVFYIVGGVDNGGSPSANLVNPMLFATYGNAAALPYGQYGDLGPPHPAYGARKAFYSDVVSSDLGVGLWGIELPPYLGIARLYGVYELADFMAHLDSTIGAFQSDRLTPIANPPTNLLRTDATQQTLFIRQGGGNDVTGTPNAHTYLVPESAIDISLLPTYSAGDVFNTYEYVVECVIFGFSEGWINKNNFVLARLNTGTGADITDDMNPELTDVSMVIPCAAHRGDALYQAYERTVYQGDPYMTRDGSTIQIADYKSRYGQISQANAFQLATPIEQFDPTTGVMTVERPNPRALQVVASMDFYTTLGTGKIGGLMFSGTPLDAGYIDDATAGALDRIPTSSSSKPWRVNPRAFTAGQITNTSRSSVSIQLSDTDLINGTSAQMFVQIVQANGTFNEFLGSTVITGPTYFNGSNTLDLATSLALQINGDAKLNLVLTALVLGDRVILVAKDVGTNGSGTTVTLGYKIPPDPFQSFNNAAQLLDGYGFGLYPSNNNHPVWAVVTSGTLTGGFDIPVNAGTGNSAISMGGMTERLPLGILVSDSDFLSENPLGDNASAMRTYPGGIRPVYSNIPLTTGGAEYTRFLNDPGSLLSMCDGGILQYIPYTPSTLSGTKKFRLYRGGGSAFVLSGNAPGGPVDWISDSFPQSLKPVLKGAVLACKALLVRNFHEDAFTGSPNPVRSEGDELQMVVLTQAVYGNGSTQADGVTLSGQISPTGYGEGYAASDRYLLEGRPMDRGRTRTTPNPALQPAPFFK